MDDASPTLLLTRPDAQSREFLAECEEIVGRRIPVVIAPAMKIVDVGDIPDLDRFETIIATSSHAVRRLGAEGALRGRKVFAVGEGTAGLAREFGAKAEALGQDGAEFLENCEAIEGPCLYVRGAHVRVDLASALVGRGVACEDAVVYDQLAQPLGCAADALLAGALPVIAPVFSARTAELLGRTTDIRAPLTMIAMSPAVAAAWNGAGDIRIVAEPTSSAMSKAVAACF
ncbi:uroporphyrinogen-III synthase [Boseongicola aestuarii]|uniref:Uroporphyrinogen-III synthase n=1 Tax=Boseongicola aestuarii TaxID=1470561 RepID=A0A238J2S0_9RHOB|nr:uroporphyrinogen-III synthase [Boseongicola aestuarii]SMX25019.1 uroporphyrinogen-III synthase [Boseongicola aestuarii]